MAGIVRGPGDRASLVSRDTRRAQRIAELAGLGRRPKLHPSARRASRLGSLRVLGIMCAVAAPFVPGRLWAQRAETPPAPTEVVTEIGQNLEELPSWLFSPFTGAYLRPAGEVYASFIYEADVVHYRRPDHIFTEEIELGLSNRINVAVKNAVERYDGTLQDSSLTLETRYALADWGKLPLNPALFAEYKFGTGNILHDEGAPTPGKKLGPHGFDTSMDVPDAYELRLLLSEKFFRRVEWSLTPFFEQEISGDRRREWGIAQSVLAPLLPSSDKLQGGVDVRFSSSSDKMSRGKPYNSCVIGPTAAWTPTRNSRLDLAPLFGVNHKSPELEFFVVFSYRFAGRESRAAESKRAGREREGTEAEVEPPTSTRAR